MATGWPGDKSAERSTKDGLSPQKIRPKCQRKTNPRVGSGSPYYRALITHGKGTLRGKGKRCVISPYLYCGAISLLAPITRTAPILSNQRRGLLPVQSGLVFLVGRWCHLCPGTRRRRWGRPRDRPPAAPARVGPVLHLK